MPNLDSILQFFGLCRNSHFTQMQDNYSRIISMTQKRSQRLEKRVHDLNEENVNLKTKLERSEFFCQAYADLLPPPDKYATEEAWKARSSIKARRYG